MTSNPDTEATMRWLVANGVTHTANQIDPRGIHVDQGWIHYALVAEPTACSHEWHRVRETVRYSETNGTTP